MVGSCICSVEPCSNSLRVKEELTGRQGLHAHPHRAHILILITYGTVMTFESTEMWD